MPLYRDIIDIARVTIDTLGEIGVDECCFIGGMACKLYTRGKGRKPKDLDILCLTDYPGGAEAIKQQLCEEDDRFFTVPARNHKDNWTVLWWRTDSDEPGFEKFKVDILVPGDVDLPDIHPDYVVKIDRFPCAPLHLLLFHKLKAWSDRRYSPRRDLRAKTAADARDIGDLLRIANKTQLKVMKYRPYITDPFRRASYSRLKKFDRVYPEYTELWEGLGLPNPTEL